MTLRSKRPLNISIALTLFYISLSIFVMLQDKKRSVGRALAPVPLVTNVHYLLQLDFSHKSASRLYAPNEIYSEMALGA